MRDIWILGGILGEGYLDIRRDIRKDIGILGIFGILGGI